LKVFSLATSEHLYNLKTICGLIISYFHNFSKTLRWMLIP